MSTVTDYYGTTFEVQVILKSSGPYVYLDRHPEPALGAESMDRLTPEEARELGRQLVEAAEEARQ